MFEWRKNFVYNFKKGDKSEKKKRIAVVEQDNWKLGLYYFVSRIIFNAHWGVIILKFYGVLQTV